MPSSSVDPGNGVATVAEINPAASEAMEPSSPAGYERLVSSLRKQAEGDDLREKHDHRHDNRAAMAMITTRVNSSSKGMDRSVHDMMKKVKIELGSNAPVLPPLCGKKRGLNGLLSEPNTPLLGMCSPPPGFPRKPQYCPSRHDGDGTGWESARERLQGAVSPPLERAFAENDPSDVVKSSYKAMLQAANYTSFSLGYALELEKKLAARDAEVAALREQLESAKAELAAVQHVLGSDVDVRRRAEHVLDAYKRWRDVTASAAPSTSTAATQQMIQTNGRHRRPCPSTKYDSKEWVL